jgi:hypothetical protein
VGKQRVPARRGPCLGEDNSGVVIAQSILIEDQALAKPFERMQHGGQAAPRDGIVDSDACCRAGEV